MLSLVLYLLLLPVSLVLKQLPRHKKFNHLENAGGTGKIWESALCYLVSSSKDVPLLSTSICPSPQVLIFHFIMHSFSLSAILPFVAAP